MGIFSNCSVSARDHVVVYLYDAISELPIKTQILKISKLGYFAPECLPPEIDFGTA
jgi:hypothetical protein